MQSTLYLRANRPHVAPYVVFSGDPWRVEVLAQLLDEPKKLAFNREFNTYTGTYQGMPVTVSSTGIGAPSAAIAMEEMYQCGMEVAVRMGTVMGLKDDMLGKFNIPVGSMREERTSATYVPLSYPAVADLELVHCMNKSVVQHGYAYVNGINCTMDGFYSQMRQSPLSERLGLDVEENLARLKRYNISGIDMESSCMLVLANLMGIKGCVVTITTVLENLKGSLEGEARTKAEEDLCQVVLDGLLIYHREVKKGE